MSRGVRVEASVDDLDPRDLPPAEMGMASRGCTSSPRRSRRSAVPGVGCGRAGLANVAVRPAKLEAPQSPLPRSSKVRVKPCGAAMVTVRPATCTRRSRRPLGPRTSLRRRVGEPWTLPVPSSRWTAESYSRGVRPPDAHGHGFVGRVGRAIGVPKPTCEGRTQAFWIPIAADADLLLSRLILVGPAGR